LKFVSDGSILETYPSLNAYHENFKKLPGLKEYLLTCKDKDFNFNGGTAKINGIQDF
jgi:hypothetical protein